jgi:hypothetical protein
MTKAARNYLFELGLRRHIGEQCLEVLLEINTAFYLYHERLKENKHHGTIASDYQKFHFYHVRGEQFEILHLFRSC